MKKMDHFTVIFLNGGRRKLISYPSYSESWVKSFWEKSKHGERREREVRERRERERKKIPNGIRR